MTHSTVLYSAAQGHETLAKLWAWAKPKLMQGQRLELSVKEAKRSTQQNRLLWARLGEISRQVVWHGQKLSAEDWKIVLTAGLKKQRVVPGLDSGFVVLGDSTSRMTVAEMNDLLTLIEAFGAQQGVRFSDLAAAGVSD